MEVELIITNPSGARTRYRLGRKTVIGRQPECDIVLSDPQASRLHCAIEQPISGIAYAEDLGSANGTWLNGAPLRSRKAFKPGDVLQIGATQLALRILTSAGEEQKQPLSPKSSQSIVRLEDEETRPVIDFVQQADAPVLPEQEGAGADLDHLKRAMERLRLLVEVGQAMGKTLDYIQLLDICLDKLFEIFPQADRGIVVLYGPDGSLPARLSPQQGGSGSLDRRKGAATRVKFRSAEAHDQESKLSRTVINQLRRERQSVLLTDGGGATAESMVRFQIKSLMCAPLLAGPEDLGLIQLETKSQAFKPDDLGVLTAVAGQVAVVIQNSELALSAAAAAAQRENLSHFLSPELVEQVLRGQLSVELGGAEKKGAIFFADIVGFTKLAGQMRAQNVVALLNRYFAVMQNIVFQRGGSIDKCEGDNIMAHWGVLGNQPDFSLQAVTAALEMQNALFAFNRDEAQKKEIELPPLPLGQGIGLNTGLVYAGNIGSDRKIEFTVIGETVNISSRLEGLAGRGQVFIGAPAWEELKGRLFCIRLPACRVKNVARPLEIYSVRGVLPPEALEDGAPAAGQMLFSLPCFLAAKGTKTAAVAIALQLDKKGGAKLALKAANALPAGTVVSLEWNVPEKRSWPKLDGQVESCGPFDRKEFKAFATHQAEACSADALFSSVRPGVLVLNVQNLPAETARWMPGVTLESDLKTSEEIVRI
jgi:adenylate cyclase